MTSDPSINVPSDEPENGVLAETGAIDTSDLGLLTTNTAHVTVILPTGEDDDDDDVVDDDDISILFDSLLSGDTVTAQQEDVAAVVIDAADVGVEEAIVRGAEVTREPVDEEIDVVEAEIIDDDTDAATSAVVTDAEKDDAAEFADDSDDVESADDGDVEESDDVVADTESAEEDAESEDAESEDEEPQGEEDDAEEEADRDESVADADADEDDDSGRDESDEESEDHPEDDGSEVGDAAEDAPSGEFTDDGSQDDIEPEGLESEDIEPEDESDDDAPDDVDSANASDDESTYDDSDAPDDEADDADSATDESHDDASDVTEPSDIEEVTEAPDAEIAPAGAVEEAGTVDEQAAAEASVTTEKTVEEPTVSETRDIHDLERVTVRTGAVETTPAPRRLGEVGEGASRETPDLLTADRLLDPNRKPRPEPEGAWQHFVYSISGKRINLGDGKRARERKALTARIAAPITGGSRFVPVLSRKGGVGKTTVTTLIGMALADARDDRVVAVDANPDRGTLAERISRSSMKTVRDLVRVRDEIRGYNDLSGIVSRDETRLDVLASDSDPRVAEAFSDIDYRHVADVASRYYSIVLTDTGTGIVHSVMGATLDLADQLVIVAGLSVDEARAASETLTWLETNGFSDIARGAIVVLNQTSAGAPVVRMNEVEEHFRSRVSEVVRIPYDPMIASGSAITFRDLQPETRVAARELAALVVNGLRGTSA